MASSAVSGIDTKFLRLDTSSSGGVYITMGEVTSISGPSSSRTVIDVTSFDSVGGYKEFIAALRESGDMTLEMNFTDASFAPLQADFESDVRQSYRILLPPVVGSKLDFTGLVTTLGVSVVLDDKISMPVTIKISGAVDYGPVVP